MDAKERVCIFGIVWGIERCASDDENGAVDKEGEGEEGDGDFGDGVGQAMVDCS